MSRDNLVPIEDCITAKHYLRLSGSYDDFLFYSPEFVHCLSAKMVERLRLEEDDVLVDLGGGTGIYSREILDQVPLRQPVLLIDPCQEMLDKAPKHPRLRCVCADALAFSKQPGSYDKIVIKETIHHVDDKARLFRNLHERLAPGGVLLLVHIPPEIDYPLFEKALERSRTWHADPKELVRLLDEAGFAVRTDTVRYLHALPKEKYFAIVRGRYMSLLSSFEDDELEAGLAEMAETYRDQNILEFVDHFDFITATNSF